jgi:hypothetical protein
MNAPEAGAYYRPSRVPKDGSFVVRALEVTGHKVRVSVRLSPHEWVELTWGLCVFRGMEKLAWHEALVLGEDLS